MHTAALDEQECTKKGMTKMQNHKTYLKEISIILPTYLHKMIQNAYKYWHFESFLPA